MISRDPLARLRHIDFHISGILETIGDIPFEGFAGVYHLERTAERGISIISEAAKLLPPELRASYPEIPWISITRIGNLLRHEYEKIDSRIIWDIVRNNLPEMHVIILRMISDLEATER